MLDAGAKGAIGVFGVLIALAFLKWAWKTTKGALYWGSVATIASGIVAKDFGEQAIKEIKAMYKCCQFCQELVKSKAIVCKHCHRDLM